MPAAHASYSQRIPPTSPSHAVACRLVAGASSPSPSSSSPLPSTSRHPYPASRGHLSSHLVTARDDTIQVWEVRSQGQAQAQGDTSAVAPVQHRLHHLKTKVLFGVITGLCTTRTIQSDADGLDRLLVSFKDAKVALLEWDAAAQDLATISIHTYERSDHLAAGLPANFKPQLAVDPESRCSALLLPRDAIAVIPFTSSSDLDLLDELDDDDDDDGFAGLYAASDQRRSDRDTLPYTPSFILPFADVDAGIRNVRHVAFLPDFQKPTLAVLCEPDKQGWTGSLAIHRDTAHLYIFTLDLSSTHHPVLTHVTDLPYDALYLAPCPTLGGLVLATPSVLVHIDQSGKLTGLRINDWVQRTTSNPAILAMPDMPDMDDVVPAQQPIDLADSHLVWIQGLSVPTTADQGQPFQPPPGSALVFLADGRVMSLRATVDGRSVSALHLDAVSNVAPSPQPPPSLAIAIPQSPDDEDSGRQGRQLLAGVFVGSMLGNSSLVSLHATPVQQDADARDADGGAQAKTAMDLDLDLDDDADLYGDSSRAGGEVGASSKSTHAAARVRHAISLRTDDVLPSLGPISDLTPAVIRDGVQRGDGSGVVDDDDDDDIVKIVAAHGMGLTSGITHLEEKIQPRGKQSLVGASDSASGSSESGWTRVLQLGQRYLLLVAAGGQETFVCVIDGDKSLRQLGTVDGEVLDAALTMAATSTPTSPPTPTLLAVQPDGLYAHDLASSDFGDAAASRMASSPQGARIAHATMRKSASGSGRCTGLVACLLHDKSLKLWRWDSTEQTFSEVPLPHAVAEKRLWHAQLLIDATGATDSLAQSSAKTAEETANAEESQQSRRTAPAPPVGGEEDEVDYGEEDDGDGDAAMSNAPQPSSPSSSSSSDESSTRLALITLDGSLELYAVHPDVTLLWRSNTLLDVPMRLDGLAQGEDVVVCSDGPEETKLEQAWVGTLGDCLAVAAVHHGGLLNVWTASLVVGVEPTGEALVFNKALTKLLPPTQAETVMDPPDGEVRTRSRVHFIAQSAAASSDRTLTTGAGHLALFVAGCQPGWVGASRHGGLHFFESSLADVHAYAWLGGERYIYAHGGGVFSARLPPDMLYDLPIARTPAFSTGRTYTRVRPFPATRCLVAASVYDTPFVLFDPEDGAMIRDPALDPTPAHGQRGCVELFKDDWRAPLDGFELEQNETVSALELLTLTSASTPTGLKEFIAVGTTVFNGEDRPTRGATYIFDVVEVVPAAHDAAANVRLKLLVKDDARGPVTALCDISGYLVSAIANKLYVRAFENHELLIHVAFLDTHFLTTSLRRLGSTLLLGDLRKSLTFVGFQEEPYKLTVFARDYAASPAAAHVTTGNYLVSDEGLVLLSTDASGALRLFEYDAGLAALGAISQFASRLVLRAEFQCAGEHTCSAVLSGPVPAPHDTAAGGGGLGTGAAAAAAAAAAAGGEESSALSTSNRILLGSSNGSLALVSPAPHTPTRSLALLQNLLVRHTQHAAALNPRGFRLVGAQNRAESGVVRGSGGAGSGAGGAGAGGAGGARGVLDGQLLRTFVEGLGGPKMAEVARLVAAGGVGAGAGAGMSAEEERGGEEEGREGKEGEDVRRLLQLLRSVASL